MSQLLDPCFVCRGMSACVWCAPEGPVVRTEAAPAGMEELVAFELRREPLTDQHPDRFRPRSRVA